MQVDEIMLQQVSPSPTAPVGFVVAAQSVSAAGTGLFFFVEKGAYEDIFSRTTNAGGASFPNTKTAVPYHGLLIKIGPDYQEQTKIEGLDVTNPMIDLFPSGDIVIVGPRACRYRDGSTDLNCIVYSAQGALLRSFLVGDGVQDAFADRLGRIWVSYFDEGIFGNLGWGNEDDAKPMGSSGLNCFDKYGKVIWNFNQANSGETLVDCYAMNVDGAKTWIYFLDGFPLFEIADDFQTRRWDVGLEGCGSLAVSETRLLFTGQYNDSPGTVYIAHWKNDSIGQFRKTRLVKPDGRPTAKASLVCRGSILNYFDDEGWFQFAL